MNTATSQCKGWIPNSASNCRAAGCVVGDPLFRDSEKQFEYL